MKNSLEEIAKEQEAKIIELEAKISHLEEDKKQLESDLEDMELEKDDAVAERRVSEDEAMELENERDELQDKLDETIVPQTLEEEMKLQILKRIQNQCTLIQIETLHQFAIDYFPTFNPHI